MKRSVMTGRRAVERGDWVEAALRSKGGEAASSKYKALAVEDNICSRILLFFSLKKEKVLITFKC